ncbi:MAG: energy-coupled thiamine transporter ThiT [Clostridia bacterium]|nr:energy-coupled thiamine transporter ThiT [Clostridia bacterium]
MLKDIKNYFANFDGTTNSCRTIFLWIAVALVIAIIASKVIFARKKKNANYSEQQLAVANKKLNGGILAVVLVFATAVIITFAVCYFVEVSKGENNLTPILFYPLLALAISAVACAVAIALKPIRIVKLISAVVCLAIFVVVLVCMIVYYASGEADEAFSNIGLYVSGIVLAAAIITLACFADKRGKSFDTRTIAFAAVCVALSFALSYIRIFKMPMGGSITFASMLPIMLFAFMFGSKKGILVGAVYGILQAIQDPWIIHPAQFVLDYLAAFGAIGLTGCIRDFKVLNKNMRAQFFVGAIVACAFRFLCHYFAGVFAFGAYGAGFAAEYNMPALANAYFYSFVYQCMYIIPELMIVVVVGLVAFASKNFRRHVELYSAVKQGVVKVNSNDINNLETISQEVSAKDVEK